MQSSITFLTHPIGYKPNKMWYKKEALIRFAMMLTGDDRETIEMFLEQFDAGPISKTEPDLKRDTLYHFITWYNAKPKVEKPMNGCITTDIVEEFIK